MGRGRKARLDPRFREAGAVRERQSLRQPVQDHPPPDARAPLTFAVIGDFGTGIRNPSRPGRHQKDVADALEAAVDERGVRLVLTTGDNIYSSKTVLGIPVDETGDEDDDWFFTFYQPYRYIINRVPVYPCVGNHDGERDGGERRPAAIADNFYLNERFSGEESAGRASIGPGLFYRFNYGADVEFVCIDTSRQSLLFGNRFFRHPNHAAFLDAALRPPSPKGRAGASRSRTTLRFARAQTRQLALDARSSGPALLRSGRARVLSGHEHNFQLSRV